MSNDPKFGYCLWCPEPHEFLSNRFLHVFLLHLPLRYCLDCDSAGQLKKPKHKYDRLCNVWHNGILWQNDELEVLVQVSESNRCVTLLMSHKDGFEAHQISCSLLREIHLLRNKFCPCHIDEYVIVFVLPPHTSHLSQPLDRGCFSPSKSYWKKVCHQFYSKNNAQKNITSYDFVGLFSEAWSSAMTLKNVIASFAVTGIYPFNRSAIKLPEEDYKEFRPEKLCKDTGIAYIPLYSPISHPLTKKHVINHSTSSSSSTQDDCIIHVKPSSSSISKFLNTPIPLSKTSISSKQIKPAGGVITSADYIKQMEEKIALKQRKEEEK